MSAPFVLTSDNEALAQRIIAKYPHGRQASAVIPLLDIVQRQNGGWLSREAMDFVAQRLDMPAIRVYEVASFYTMFNLKPIGRHFVQVCTTTPCWLRGSDAIVHACEKRLGIGLGDTTADGAFTLVEVECLGACVNSPMVQVGDDYYEDLTPETMTQILDDLAAGRQPRVGPQSGRKTSEPLPGLTTLTDAAVQTGGTD
ncbi:MAG: NADH-quinone oxidoreductase subunit NuoE [Alphaproteobacteria bacterium]|nr:NADH-quinone oxidoreductase subunit NuoE [Alphaproteobacteria bacterium]